MLGASRVGIYRAKFCIYGFCIGRKIQKIPPPPPPNKKIKKKFGGNGWYYSGYMCLSVPPYIIHLNHIIHLNQAKGKAREVEFTL